MSLSKSMQIFVRVSSSWRFFGVWLVWVLVAGHAIAVGATTAAPTLASEPDSAAQIATNEASDLGESDGPATYKPLDALATRILGKVSRPSIYQWRQSPVMMRVNLGQVVELTQFDVSQKGLAFIVPGDDSYWELGLTRITVSATDGSDQLALTTYEQPGRPSHWQLRTGFGYSVVEGIGNNIFTFLRPTQFVLMAQTRLLYRYYPGAMAGMEGGEQLAAVLNPALTEQEIDNVSDSMPPGMILDASRMSLQFGLSLEVYDASGLHSTLSVALGHGLPNGTKVDAGNAWELAWGAGYAF